MGNYHARRADEIEKGRRRNCKRAAQSQIGGCPRALAASLGRQGTVTAACCSEWVSAAVNGSLHRATCSGPSGGGLHLRNLHERASPSSQSPCRSGHCSSAVSYATQGKLTLESLSPSTVFQAAPRAADPCRLHRRPTTTCSLKGHWPLEVLFSAQDSILPLPPSARSSHHPSHHL